MGFVGGQGVIPGQRLSSLPLQAIITHQLHRVPKQGPGTATAMLASPTARRIAYLPCIRFFLLVCHDRQRSLGLFKVSAKVCSEYKRRQHRHSPQQRRAADSSTRNRPTAAGTCTHVFCARAEGCPGGLPPGDAR